MVSTLGLFMALSVAVLYASFGLLSRHLLKDSDNPLAFAVIYGGVTAVLSFVFVFFEPWKFQGITGEVLLITASALLLFTAFEATEFFAHKHLEASRFAILYQLTPAITFIASVFLLKESVSLEKIIAVALIIFGNLVAVYRHGGNLTVKGVLLGLGTAFWLGLAYVADKAVFDHYPIPLYMALTYGVPSVIILQFLGSHKLGKLKKELERAISWRLLLLSLISVSGYYLLLKTFQLMEASLAVPIAFSGAVFATLGGILLLKERSSIPQKIIGIIFVFVGVILLK